MTRFDADTPAERRKLFVEAIAAHRERASAFCTFEAHEDASSSAPAASESDAAGALDGEDVDADGEGNDADGDAEATEALPPWVQFGDGTLNLDCTDEELDRLKSLLAEFPAFKIDDIARPDEAEGVNVRVSALADPNRVAQWVDRAFRDVYDQPEGFRAWVSAV
ncbi:hypothetical protein NGM10_12865 [Halorussus salilacus]|uniref:hypothetical protein n=1 Tax=Halorussus salilacus TaxID=2953750 RepID=UPI00209DBD77|nr:hypothetical protein [Halorussus salilacus]USZ67615.1 hypothetical protein NGM10_12865 [Halorussus salilacus]